MSISWILAVIALVLAIMSLLGIGAAGTALTVAVICLALAHVLPGVPMRVRRF
jgi:hypothetical protein